MADRKILRCLPGTNALSSQLLRLAAQDTFPSGQGPDSYILWVRWLP